MGALFFTVLMVAGFSVLSLALDAQTDIVTTQRMVSDIEIKKQQETFGILVSVNGTNLLDVFVNNQGQNPVEISSIWITNKTLPDQPATRYDINYDDAFVPSGFTSDVVLTQTLEIIPDAYDIKVISSLGTIKTVELVVGAGASTSGLRAELITDPPDVIIGQNVTIAMIVTNTGETIIQNVEPDPLSLGGTGSVIANTTHTPLSVNLDRGESVMFSWDYQVTGVSGDDLNFSAIARGDFVTPDDVWTSVVSDTSILREPTDGGTSSTEIIVLNQDLLSRPEIFMIIPGPFGDSDDRGLWGVNVVNPTSQDMKISKITISALNPSDNSFDQFFIAGNCNDIPVPSGGADEWQCHNHNQMTWEPSGSPVVIPPFSVHEFLVKSQPGSIISTSDLHTVLIQTHVYSSSGQFGKGSYGSSMKAGGESVVNVFLSNVYPGTGNDDDIISSISGISSGTTVVFNATLAEFETGGHKIEDEDPPGKATLIINIPKGWTNVVVNESSGFDSVVTSTFPDGSSQMIGIVSNELISGTETMKFRATAPTVTSTQLYVMYMLANGVTDSGWTIGPLGEIVLQVVP